jgi:hypothetical protein
MTRWTAICALLASACTAVVEDIAPPEESSSASSLVTSGASIAGSDRVADYAVRNTSTGAMRVYAGVLSGGSLSFHAAPFANAATAAPAPWRLLGQ